MSERYQLFVLVDAAGDRFVGVVGLAESLSVVSLQQAFDKRVADGRCLPTVDAFYRYLVERGGDSIRRVNFEAVRLSPGGRIDA